MEWIMSVLGDEYCEGIKQKGESKETHFHEHSGLVSGCV